MSEIVGYKLVDGEGTEIQVWGGTWGQCPAIPNPIHLPNGDVVCGAVTNENYGGFALIPIEMEEPPKPFEPLSRPAFLFMMQKLGITKQAVYDLIDAMPDGDEKVLARIVFDEQQTFARDNALLAALAGAAGLTEQQLDSAWRIGEGLTW